MKTTRRFWLVAALLGGMPMVAVAATPPAGGATEVRSFGATCNGTADDTRALQAAADAVPAGGGRLAFPAGATCRIHATIRVHSHTHVEGNGATLLALQPWDRGTARYGYALLENVHYDAPAVTDTDISVDGMKFDYGDFGPAHKYPAGGGHALRFQMASNLSVTNSVFQIRGSEDAIAGLDVHNMRVEGNRAYGFVNCAYDFWEGSSDVSVIGNYAETERSAQIVNFNPEGDIGKGLHAQNFLLAGNTLKGTGPRGIPIQIEPLGAGTSVSNVTVRDNVLENVYLVMRRAITGALVTGNRFSDVRGGSEVIVSYPFDGGTPSHLTITGNTITNPETTKGLGVIRVEAEDSIVTGNEVTGTGYTSPGIYTGHFRGTISGNRISSGRIVTP